MKRIIRFFGVLILFFCCMNVNASELIHIDNDKELEMKIDDPYSENVLQNGLFLESKVQICNNSLECMDVTRLLLEDNAAKMKKDKLFVDNCIIVNSPQEIAFDTSKVISAVHYDDMYYIQYETVADAKEALEILNQYPSVVYAVTDEVIAADSMLLDSVAEAASPLFGKDGYTHLSWGITQTGLDIFADYVSNHASGLVKIAVVDTGVYSSHPFLQGHISNTRYDLGVVGGNADDVHGHGTFVTGIIVDAMQSLNFSIIPVRVFDVNGDTTTGLVALGIEIAADAGADVINVSIRELLPDNDHILQDDAIKYAIEEKDAVVVVVAGNDSKDTMDICPAHMDEPIVVSGIDKKGVKYVKTNYGDSVDVTAPAVDIKSCVIPSLSTTGYGLANGTSLAAPHVTAAAAMLRLLYPTYSAETIQNIINTCVDAVEPSDDGHDCFGHGLMKISNRILTLPFTDVSKSHYFYDGVYSGYGRGYISGLTSTTFAPTANMQRQDVAVVLYKMAGSPNVVYRNIFSDVSAGHYFAKAAVWAYDNGIISGLVGGSLGVGQSITREDFVVMLSRYAQCRGLDINEAANLNIYPDSNQVSSYANQAVQWAVYYGIMGNDAYLWPKTNICRADMAVILYKFLCL